MKYRFISPSVLYLTLGEKNSCRVSYRGHSATSSTGPTAQYRAIMKIKKIMPSAPDLGTRHIYTLPSAANLGTRHTPSYAPNGLHHRPSPSLTQHTLHTHAAPHAATPRRLPAPPRPAAAATPSRKPAAALNSAVAPPRLGTCAFRRALPRHRPVSTPAPPPLRRMPRSASAAPRPRFRPTPSWGPSAGWRDVYSRLARRGAAPHCLRPPPPRRLALAGRYSGTGRLDAPFAR